MCEFGVELRLEFLETGYGERRNLDCALSLARSLGTRVWEEQGLTLAGLCLALLRRHCVVCLRLCAELRGVVARTDVKVSNGQVLAGRASCGVT